MTDADDRFARALAAFDAENALDPETIMVHGVPRPREQIRAEWVAAWVARLAPDAPVAVRLAARCQHLKRFARPRGDYPEGRAGYLRWRRDAAAFHAATAAAILQDIGYDDATIEAVRRINLKQGLGTDPNTQVIEDALCLAFLEHESAEFAPKHPREKVVAILAKTWRKMSPEARDAAAALPLAAPVQAALEEALAGAS